MTSCQILVFVVNVDTLGDRMPTGVYSRTYQSRCQSRRSPSYFEAQIPAPLGRRDLSYVVPPKFTRATPRAKRLSPIAHS